MSRDPYRMPALFDAWLTTDSVAEDASDEASRLEAAVEEFWTDEAAELLRERIDDTPDYFIDWARFGADLSAAADVVARDPTEAEWANAAALIGLGVMRDMRRYLMKCNAEIEARCIKRAEEGRGSDE